MQLSAPLVTLAFASLALANPIKRQEDQNAQLNSHNALRAKHQAPALTWSNELANYAAQVAGSCNYAHSGGSYGENIAAGGGDFTDQAAFDLWASEESKYNYDNPGFSSDTGHFTQIVWKGTTQLGCARQSCDSIGGISPGYFVVCEYSPAGNIVGNNNQYFRDNVLPAK